MDLFKPFDPNVYCRKMWFPIEKNEMKYSKLPNMKLNSCNQQADQIAFQGLVRYLKPENHNDKLNFPSIAIHSLFEDKNDRFSFRFLEN